MPPRSGLIVFLAAFVAALAAPLPVAAQNWPSRPITIYVGNSAGGSLDTVARLLAPLMQKKWGQPVVVELRPGGGGGIAAAALARSQPDGYTLAVGPPGPIQFLFVKDPGFAIDDITPVSIVAETFYTLVTSPKSGLQTLPQLLAKAKSAPGALKLGVVTLSPHDTQVHDMLRVLGIDATIVGYKGYAPDIEGALLRGDVDASTTGNVAKVLTGQITALAYGGEQRSPDMPQVPTFKELGIDYHPVAYYILWGRAGTPDDVLEKIASACADLVKTPEFEARVSKPFSIPGVGSTHAFAVAEVRRDYERTKRAAELAGIKPQ
jgi:tripartite-type tricarboxylate transporter receptor subunit TctC